jgi:glycosyltransferase involved in cell wall biosynthesis
MVPAPIGDAEISFGLASLSRSPRSGIPQLKFEVPMDHETSAVHPLSIGYYSVGWPLDGFPNGIVSYVADMAIQLREMGHQVAIVTAEVAGKVQDASVYDMQLVRQRRGLARRVLEGVAYRITPRWTSDQSYRRVLATMVRRAITERDIKIFEMEESFGWPWWLSKAISIPICVRLHGPWFIAGRAEGVPEDAAFHRRIAAEGRAIATAKVLSSSSRDVLEQTRVYYGLALEDAEVIYPPTAPVPAAAQWRLEDADPYHVLFIGRFDRYKGGDLIIKAFGRVLHEVPQARLSFVGPDPGCTDADGRRWSLESFVRAQLPGALELGQVKLLGQQPFSALASLRRKAMVTVVCSRYENAPRALIEAMSLGCPIVASRVGGIPEIMQDQLDGLLHRSEDVDDLATQIIALLDSPARSAELGRHAALTCERRFYPDIIARQSVEFYRRSIGRWITTGKNQIN